jgi:hypothetical protein
MNERDWAERFSRDVDGLLRRGKMPEAEPLPDEYRDALAAANRLAGIDFSGETRIRLSLRRRVLARAGAREGWQSQEEWTMPNISLRRGFALAFSAVVLVGLLAVTLAVPGGLASAAQSAASFLQELLIGEHTVFYRFEPDQQVVFYSDRGEPAREPSSAEPGTLETVEGEDFGISSSGSEVQHLVSVAEAQAAGSFDLREPGYLPDGYTLREVTVAGPGVVLTYDGPGGVIVLGETWVGETPDMQADAQAILGVAQDTAIESVSVDGHEAGWGEHMLVWEADDVSYFVSGSGLTCEEAIRIAESLD